MTEIPKVRRDGKVAVLVSPGFGAGWFSWNKDHPACLFDPDIVAIVERWPDRRRRQVPPEDVVRIGEIATERWPNFYTGGSRDLVVEWVPEGTAFCIDEYDGSESLTEDAATQWVIA